MISHYERESATQNKAVTNVTLKRGYINSTELCPIVRKSLRRKAVMAAQVQRKSGSIILCADDGSAVLVCAPNVRQALQLLCNVGRPNGRASPWTAKAPTSTSKSLSWLLRRLSAVSLRLV